jgi:predicted secreted hydrolase
MAREAKGGRREAQDRGRRRLLQWLGVWMWPGATEAQSENTGPRRPPASRLPSAPHLGGYAPVARGRSIRFPDDEGSHPEFRTEWWYVTGWLERAARDPLGFQITFFRTRPEIDERNPSAFTPRQVLIAHAALSDPARGRLLHDQRVARAALGLAGASAGPTKVWIDDWSLAREGSGYRARIPVGAFALDLAFAPTQPPLLQGEDGYSRKGPHPASASHYYSVPHLAVSGTIHASGQRTSVTGRAWLDHEWSSSYMDSRAQGWDWIGINLEDGGALMAFRMRDAKGGKVWAGGAHRDARGVRRAFAPAEVDFTPLRQWRSPRTGATYPVAWRVRAGATELTLEPLMDDQESDSRASVGTVYWEGAVRALAAGNEVGRGYLELTGYWKPMKL